MMSRIRPRTSTRRSVRAALCRLDRLGVLGALVASVILSGSLAAAPIRQDNEPPRPFDPGQVAFDLELVATGLDQPLHLVDPGDGSGRLFVVEKTGAIQILRDGRVASEPLLDLSHLVSGGSEQGLLSLALHPEFLENGLLYVNYTDANGDTQVVRYRVDPENPDRVDPNSAETILTVEQPYRNHNGGLLLFGPDGYLYVGLGDGGSGGDPEGHGQNLATLLGSILRIDVDRTEDGRPYAIPPDNPFVGVEGARPEIWAYGLRNPWRFSFDRLTGDLYIADVGQSDREEVNFEPADSPGGVNYGWNIMEGDVCFRVQNCDMTGLELPVATYATHELGCSITGGYVYRGTAIPELTGVYIFADYCSGFIWGLGRDADGAWVMSDPIPTNLSVSSFGEDADGELYLIDLGGRIVQIVPAAS